MCFVVRVVVRVLCVFVCGVVCVLLGVVVVYCSACFCVWCGVVCVAVFGLCDGCFELLLLLLRLCCL